MTDMDKSAMRRVMKIRRARLATAMGAAGPQAAKHFPMHLLAAYGPNIALYMPMGSEIDSRPLMARLSRAGARLALPCIGQGNDMVYRTWRDGDRLVTGRFGVRQPASDQPEITPAVLVAPLLAFDRQGNRLGYGKGFYDRSIAGLRARRHVFVCGLAFFGQYVPSVPVDERDMPLNQVVTERGKVTFPVNGTDEWVKAGKGDRSGAGRATGIG